MSRLQFINNEIVFNPFKAIKNKPLPGFKFAIGDKVRYIGKIGLYSSLFRNGQHLQQGEILTISCCEYNKFNHSEIKEKSVYGFIGDSYGGTKPNFLSVEENFELVEQ